MDSMLDTLVVYTVAMGDGYALPSTIPEQNVKYICFTNLVDLEPNGWTLRAARPIFPSDLNRSSREQKIRPHHWLGDCRNSIYIDTSVQLTAAPSALWTYLMHDEQVQFAAFHHSFRDSVRDEFDAVFEAGFDDCFLLADQLDSYTKHFPHILSEKPAWGGVLARRHNEPACIVAMETWYSHVMRYSRRDQLSLPLALTSFPVGSARIIPDDIHHTTFHVWPRSGYKRPSLERISTLIEKQEKVSRLFQSNDEGNRTNARGACVNQEVTPKDNLPLPENDSVVFGFDSSHEMYFARDTKDHRKVYVSDRKRLQLYVKGIEHRQNWLLSDYRIPIDLVCSHDTVVDVGANSGELGIWAHSKGSSYLAFEPDPKAFKALKENVGLASAYSIALGSTNGHAEFYLNTEEADSSLFKPDTFQEKIMVEVRTLDSALLHFETGPSIRLLKIEAEGMEPEVLAGAAETLCRSEYIAVDAGPERGGENTLPDVVNALSKFGFEIVDCFLLRGTFFLKNVRFVDRKRVARSCLSRDFAGLTSTVLYYLSRNKYAFSERRRQKFLSSAHKRDARILSLRAK